LILSPDLQVILHPISLIYRTAQRSRESDLWGRVTEKRQPGFASKGVLL